MKWKNAAVIGLLCLTMTGCGFPEVFRSETNTEETEVTETPQAEQQNTVTPAEEATTTEAPVQAPEQISVAQGSVDTGENAASEAGPTDPAVQAPEQGAGRVLEFPYLIDQNPELPTGCEITSLTMLLQYNGIEADKCDLSDNYLDKGPVGTVNFREAFEGDPRDGASFGCYAPVMVNTANRYLQAAGSDLHAIDVTGQELENLFAYIDAGVPVMMWGTLDCQEGHFSVTWNVNGEDLTWFTPEHCRVLYGYDAEQVYTADPMYGEERTYPIDLFKARFNDLFQQAIVIQ